MKNIFGLKSILAILIILAFQFSVLGQDVQRNSRKFERMLRLIESFYVDTANIEKLTEKAIVSMLQDLDPHSVYISKDEVAKMNEPLEGNFEGIGISFNIFQDSLLVVSTIQGGPSEKVGMMAGDRIVTIDGKNVAGIGLKNDDVTKMLRGKKGTRVNVQIKRNGVAELLDFSIIRDKIPIYSLDASYMINKETGYIKLSRFANTTMTEFHEAMAKLKEQKLKNLILDLRGNGGGFLHIASELSDEFLPDNYMVVYTQNHKGDKEIFNATDKGSFEKGKLIVLIDEGSASASEIVAGAVQDWDRGVLIGRRTYGKGLVQRPFALTDTSLVRLTTAHYYIPSGRCIQRPYDKGVDEYRADIALRGLSGELFNADSIHFTDSLKYETLVNKRTVYGGGGVMPDIFIKLDTSKHYVYLNELSRKSVILNFTTGYIDRNRETIKTQYPTFKQFKEQFELSDNDMKALFEEGEKNNVSTEIKDTVSVIVSAFTRQLELAKEKTPTSGSVKSQPTFEQFSDNFKITDTEKFFNETIAAEEKRRKESIEFITPIIKRQVKAIIARDLYTKDSLYEILNEDDKAIEKALEIIDNSKEYERILKGAH